MRARIATGTFSLWAVAGGVGLPVTAAPGSCECPAAESDARASSCATALGAQGPIDGDRFVSGKDWCQVPREPWRGTQEVLKNRNLPIWAACGGAQGLAILSTVGVDREWDCPHCRDSTHPKVPIYTHIGHTASRPCGDYSGCVAERGIYHIRQVADDPVFARLPREFQIRESHVGQIEYVPDGWQLIATRGTGGKTKTQCMRVKDRYIYAAQFHIELFEGTLETSRKIMGNFLSLAKRWGGYNPSGKAVPAPR